MIWQKVIFLIGLVIGFLIRCYYQHFNTEDIDLTKLHYITQKENLFWVGLILFGAVVPILTYNLFPQAQYEVSSGLQIVGAVLLIIALIMFQQAHASLDRQFSHTLSIKNNHKLITTGIFNYVRHPMYSTALLIFISKALLMPNYFSLSSFAVALGLLYAVRISEEEKMMLAEFGAEYEKYQKNTCGLIPKLCKVL
jgi:protein-S-isoprenylcysteine O-methyltransferase Ste14